MLRYKKHKRHADGLTGSAVGVMDDTDREVSNFTDRAFRSLCVAEEEAFNDVPHIPSPIRGMPLSTKYHLGIFNLSVRKTQPLAQLPAISQQRGKWAPTFQPLLNCAKDRLIVAKTNTNMLCVPQPTGYKPCSKVSSLIKSFDNVENEKPEQDGFILSKGVQRGKMNMEDTSSCQEADHSEMNNDALEFINPDDKSLHESRNLHRRTAREVFLESRAEICSRLSASPCSSCSPLPDPAKKLVNQKDSLRRTAFLHSENSAFKSWSDMIKRHPAGDDSDISVPGTPPILGSATPCSPLLQRATPGARARDAGLEVGWASPSSTLSNSFDAIQMLRTVPPLPNKRMTKQSRESSHRAQKVNAENKILAEDMQVELGYQSTTEQLSILAKSKSPKKLNQVSTINQEKETVSEPSHPLPKQNEEDQEKADSLQEPMQSKTPTKEEDSKLSNKSTPPSGRIKTLIHQIEKESVKDVASLHLPDKKHSLKDSNDASMESLPSILHAKLPDLNPHSNSNTHVPPWRRMYAHKTQLEDKLLNKSLSMKESSTEQAKENMAENEDDSFEEKPSISSFNITNLLTPVIRRKSIQEALEEQPMAITPPPADTITLNDQDQREISLYHKRNEYKSKATSLLFNLKDMRKRVKCTYNPSTNLRNGHENNQTADGKLQEVSTYGIPLIDASKQLSETENSSNIDKTYVQREATKEEEAKHDFLGNVSDNYLCLRSPSQEIPCTMIENSNIPTEDVHVDENIHNEHVFSSPLSPIEHKLKKHVEYPILNLYPKEDTSVKVDQKQDAPLEGEEFPLQEENIKPDSKQEEPLDTVSMPTSYFLERDVKNAQSHTEQSLASTEIVNQCSTESEEGEKQEIKNYSLKDDLQYYAVSNDTIESSKEQHEVLKEENAEKVEDKELLVSDKQGEESAEEIKRPSSIVQFKPNLFHIKDNKIKSSSVTKSVRPLLRSLSEDCLLFHKAEDYSCTIGKGDFRVARPSSWKNRDSKLEVSKTRNMAAHNGEKCWNHVATQLLDHNREYKQIKTQHEEREIEELWEKPFCMTHDWSKNDEEIAELVKVNKSPNKNSPSLDGPFFHPVETCVSEVTGLSPECNSLLVHHTSESIKDLVNGEHASSPLFEDANTNYSPLDNGVLQFEDAISFSEDVACSTITSPMSESITCSMVASPMSVYTQSSGFTTALSALDDMSSSPLTYINSRNEKSNLSIHDISAPSGNLETKTSECIKYSQEKAPFVNSLNKAHAAKPPTVPPKTEKALRRAKRLTKKRRKTEIPSKIQEGDFQESDFVLDVPSPGNNIPSSIATQSNFNVGSCISRTLQHEESISEASTPSLPTTQRKLLQDPDSGQYFVVDIPVHFRIKTFFDPETGKYLQMSLPPSERSTPPLEISKSPFMLYQGLAPVPVASIASLTRASQMLNHSGGKSESWHEEEDDCLKMQQSIDCDSCNQSMAGTPHSMDRNAGRTRSPDIISMRDIDDFAMEAFS
ncbi:cardiac-enriched FHL2-interacting protein [Mantella aurantiaca]